MRLAGQMKGGYYPAPPEAIALAMGRLHPTGPFNVLDPCAGRGLALEQLSASKKATGYGIELDFGRAEELAGRFGKRALAPADCYSCRVSAASVQLLWLNPPYDDELGGGRGRVEYDFLKHCHDWLCVGGVLAFVVPERIVDTYSPCLRYLATHYDELRALPFPPAVRKYNEVVVLGYKRKYLKELPAYRQPDVPPLATAGDVYHIPKAEGPPPEFVKAGLTPGEIGLALAKSPLLSHLRPPPPLPLARPPLPPGKGHRALLLAAGHLDGLVRPEGEPPHVIRGVSGKERYLKESSEEERDDGTVFVKTVYSERFTLTIRAVTEGGTFHELRESGDGKA